MKWYLATIVYRIICGSGDHTAQFDEQVRLISAGDELHALYKARQIGEREEDHFLNSIHKPVLWKFVDVSELHVVEELSDGIEIYSRIREEADPGNYIRGIRLRAAILSESSVNSSINSN